MAPRIQDDYYQLDRMSNSAMTYFKRSPLHYLQFKKEETVPTAAMLFGSAFHSYVLESDVFASTYCWLKEKLDLRTTIGKQKMEEFSRANVGKNLITLQEYETIQNMHASMMKCEKARELIHQIEETEKAIMWTWKDKENGYEQEVKSKLDGVAQTFVLDLKSAANAEPGQFSRDAFNRSLHRQGAFYLDGLFGKDKVNREFYFVAIEKDAPYAVSVHRLSREMIAVGREEYRNILRDFCYWKSIGSPAVGYDWRTPYGVFEMTLPSWYQA